MTGVGRSTARLERMVDQQNKSSGLIIGLGIMVIGVAYGIQNSFGVDTVFVVIPALLVIAFLVLILIRRRNTPPRSGS